MATGSLEEKIGRMLLLGFRGLSLDESPQTRSALERGLIGGVVLFDYDVKLESHRRNIDSSMQLKALNEALRRHARHPLLIGVDQEGGRVARLKPRHGFPETPSARSLGEMNDPARSRHWAQLTATLLAEHGFNLNFAPVLDLDLVSDSPAIGRFGRSYSSDPSRIIEQGRIVIEAMRQRGILPVLKHFPGHGSAQGDSHMGWVDVSASWVSQELVPYRALIEANQAPLIMSAHLFNKRLDPVHPATLSKRVLSDLLRGELGFKGLIVSDDLDMKAISHHYGMERAVQLAIEAGVDLLLFGNNLEYDPQLAERIVQVVREMVERGDIDPDRIDQSNRRIAALFAG